MLSDLPAAIFDRDTVPVIGGKDHILETIVCTGMQIRCLVSGDPVTTVSSGGAVPCYYFNKY